MKRQYIDARLSDGWHVMEVWQRTGQTLRRKRAYGPYGSRELALEQIKFIKGAIAEDESQ